MESTDRLDKLPLAREISGPQASDGIGRALRQTFPAETNIPRQFDELIAALDVIPKVHLLGLTSRLRP